MARHTWRLLLGNPQWEPEALGNSSLSELLKHRTLERACAIRQNVRCSRLSKVVFDRKVPQRLAVFGYSHSSSYFFRTVWENTPHTHTRTRVLETYAPASFSALSNGLDRLRCLGLGLRESWPPLFGSWGKTSKLQGPQGFGFPAPTHSWWMMDIIGSTTTKMIFHICSGC